MNKFKNENLTLVTDDSPNALLQVFVNGDTACKVFEPLNYCAKIIQRFWQPTVPTRVYVRFEHPGTKEYINSFKESNGLALAEKSQTRTIADFNHSSFSSASVKKYMNEDWNDDYVGKRRFDMNVIFSTKPGGSDWYLGTDGQVPNDKFDFVTVCLHEMLHGLFFYSESPYLEVGQAIHIEGFQNRLLDFVAVETKHGDCGILSYETKSKELANALTGNTLWLRTKEKRILKLYAPGKFTWASSFNHVDPSDEPTNIMKPIMNRGEAHHYIDASIQEAKNIIFDSTAEPVRVCTAGHMYKPIIRRDLQTEVIFSSVSFVITVVFIYLCYRLLPFFRPRRISRRRNQFRRSNSGHETSSPRSDGSRPSRSSPGSESSSTTAVSSRSDSQSARISRRM